MEINLNNLLFIYMKLQMMFTNIHIHKRIQYTYQVINIEYLFASFQHRSRCITRFIDLYEVTCNDLIRGYSFFFTFHLPTSPQ